MENDGIVFRTPSKLEVFAPRPSTLSQANRNFNEIAEKIHSQPQSAPAPLNSPPANLVESVDLFDSVEPKEPSQFPGVVSGTNSLENFGQTIAAESVKGTIHKRASLVGLFNRTPSWLLSFVFHLGLILLLAIFTFSASRDETIRLEVGQLAEISPQTMSIDLELDDPEFEDNTQSLALPEMEMELPEVDLFDTPIHETFEIEDPFKTSTLSEFSSSKENPDAGLGEDSDSQGSGGKGESQETDAAKESEAVDFFGTKVYGSDIVFVIDCSSSMSQQGRWYRALNELLSTLNELDVDQNFMVILYNDRTYMMWGAAMSKSLVSATQENKNKTERWLRQAIPNSGTQPASSVRLALKKQPDAIYFLSDGELRDNTMSGLRIWNRAKQGEDGQMRKTPIHTILLSSPFGQRTMRTIAEENNGIFTFVR